MNSHFVLPVDIQDRLSDLEDLVTGLQALLTLFAEIDSMVIKPNELYCLLNPIIEQQKQILGNIKNM